MAELDVRALGLSLGILWAACVFLLGICAMLLSWGDAWVSLLADVYIGFKASFGGSVLGAVYGFVDGFIGGALVAWLYNKLQ